MSGVSEKNSWAKCISFSYVQRVLFLSISLFFSITVSGQKPAWVELMYSDNATVKNVTEAYENYYIKNQFEKNGYTQDYKRFLRNKSREAFATSSAADLKRAQDFYLSRRKQSQSKRNGASWKPLGPFDIDLNSAAVGTTPGLAHVYTVEKDGFLVAGTATAGAWKSTDNGKSWNSISKDLLITEVKAVEVRNNTIFIGGNGNIYKSADGGTSWQSSGNAAFRNMYHRTADIVSSTQAYYAATNFGLYKSDNIGADWSLKVGGNFLEIEVHPTDANIVYAVKQEGQGTAFYKSVDAGESFQQIQNGYPVASGNSEQLRTEIAVSAAAPDRIVALAAGEANGGSGLYGIYVSDDQGENWEFRCCGSGPGGQASSNNKNILAWQVSGASNGGQYYYDLALAISDSNADEIYSGGINIWKSVDGGHSFVNNADYVFGNAGQKYVHADIQDIKVYGNEVWVASDGGIFLSTDGGQTFAKKMKGIVGTDFRGFGAGAKDGEVLIGGTYHNGTLLKENNTYDGGWLSTHSGDNTHGNVNPQNNKITYSDIGIMTLPGNSSSTHTIKALTIKPNASYTIGESSEYVFHPNSGETFFLGSGGNLYKTTDNGTNFTSLKNFGSGKVTKIEIAPTDPNVIYVVYYPSYDSHKKLFRSFDGGATWEDRSPSAAVFGNSKLWIAWDISVGSLDEDELWLARTPQTSSNGNIDGKQIYHTTDGGLTWVNVSGPSLNGEYITNIIHQKGTNGGVYIGTRRSVYYKNSTMSSWELFSSGLPAITYSTNLVILYEQGNVVNATHRGVYSSKLYEIPVKEVSFQVDKTESLCAGDPFSFSSNSTGFAQNATLKWTFENGNPAVSYDSDPEVIFSGVGSHTVTLEIIENGQTYKKEEDGFITVLGACPVESVSGSAIRTYNNNFLIIPPVELETNEISFSFWVKREGSTKENAGLLLMRRFTKTTGLSMSSSGEIKYLWDKSGTGIATGLFVESNKWAHIAMSVSPTQLSVFVNGIERTFDGTFGDVQFDKDVIIGKDLNAYQYYFNGYFDELAVYNKTLTVAEVREHMNLVKYEDEIPWLLNYFQFNSQSEIVEDLIGAKHASFFAYPDYGESMAPVGKGISQVKQITEFGMHDFEAVDVSLMIESGISCDSDLGVSRIERNVEGLREGVSSDYLYIVNHFSEDEFSINGEISISQAFNDFDEVGIIEDSFKLHQVDFDDEPVWDENTRTSAISYDPDSEEKIIFHVEEEQEMQGKFLVSYSPLSASLAISDIYFELNLLLPDVVDIQWFLHPEDNFIYTELQRSGDGRRFETIYELDNERGKLAFRYEDKSPLKGRNYYRVKMTYDDLSTDYSKIDYIKVSSSSADLFLYPNPLPAGSSILLRDIRLDGSTLTIYDVFGRKLKHFSSLENGGIDVSDLNPGSYLVVVDELVSRRQQVLIIE
jgi:photosystem II stability/assembly factor-like uncharacterized protein